MLLTGGEGCVRVGAAPDADSPGTADGGSQLDHAQAETSTADSHASADADAANADATRDGSSPDADAAPATATLPIIWSKVVSAPGAQMSQRSAVTSNNNALISGDFVGVVDFGTVTRHAPEGRAAFMSLYKRDGTHQRTPWFFVSSCNSGCHGHASTRGMAVDQSGGVIITGDWDEGSIYVGGSSMSTGGQTHDKHIFAAAFDKNGAHQWSTSFGGAGIAYGLAIARSTAGQLSIAGSFTGSMTVAGKTVTSAGKTDGLAILLNADGEAQWVHSAGGPHSERATGVAFDSSGNVHVVGSFEETVTMPSNTLTSADGADGFLLSLTASGNHRWSKRFGGPNNDGAAGITADANGNMFVTGTIAQSADFGGGLLTVTGSKSDAFIASYNSDGELRWAKLLGNDGADSGHGIALGASDVIYCVGTFTQTIDFGNRTLSNLGLSNAYLAQYNTSGDVLSANQLGGSGAINKINVAAGSNIVVVSGGYSGALQIEAKTFTNAGATDIFVAGYGKP